MKNLEIAEVIMATKRKKFDGDVTSKVDIKRLDEDDKVRVKVILKEGTSATKTMKRLPQ